MKIEFGCMGSWGFEISNLCSGSLWGDHLQFIQFIIQTATKNRYTQRFNDDFKVCILPLLLFWQTHSIKFSKKSPFWI